MSEISSLKRVKRRNPMLLEAFRSAFPLCAFGQVKSGAPGVYFFGSSFLLCLATPFPQYAQCLEVFLGPTLEVSIPNSYACN